MYIKCDNVEQLDEVIKYYNITIDNINQMWIKFFLKDSNSIGINILTGEYNYILNLERKGLDYITFSQWQLQTLRDLGFSTDLAEDMLSRCDKFKRNDMNKKDQFIQLEGGKLNITKACELELFIEDKKVFKWDKSLVNKYYPTWKEIKEKYMKDNEIAESIYRKIATTIKEDIDKNIVNELIDRTFMILKENEIEVAKDILQSLGYTLTPPYVPPTDEDILARIVLEN